MRRELRWLTAAAAAVFIWGCASAPERVEGSGVPAEPPPGWIDFCDRYPHDPSCPAEKRT